MQSLPAQVTLDRVYAYMFCSPTRCSLLSGRLPIHVNTLNADPATWSFETNEGAGIASAMTGLGSVMRRGGYRTAAIGKWDAGMATYNHTPAGRGFEHSFIYFHHCNDYWTSTVSNKTDPLCSPDSQMVDLWRDDGPAVGESGTGAYEEELFAADAVRTISAHGSSMVHAPLFLFYASHVPHTPMQMPQHYLDRFLNETALSLPGRGYAAMVSVLDNVVANVTAALQATEMWGFIPQMVLSVLRVRTALNIYR